MNTPQERSYGTLANEVWNERLRAKLNVDYFGAMASWRRLWVIIFNGVSLLCSGSAAVVLVSAFDESMVVAVGLVVIASIASIVNALSPWSDEQARFLRTREEYRKCEVQWDILWNRLYAHEYENLSEEWSKYESFLANNAEAGKIAQPHRQRPWLVRKIERRIALTQSLPGDEDDERQPTTAAEKTAATS